MGSPRKVERPLSGERGGVTGGVGVGETQQAIDSVLSAKDAVVDSKANGNGNAVKGDDTVELQLREKKREEMEEEADASAPPTPLPTVAAGAEAAEAKEAWDRT
jgi:hypothetical protein